MTTNIIGQDKNNKIKTLTENNEALNCRFASTEI